MSTLRICLNTKVIYILIRYMSFWGLDGIHMMKMYAGYLSEMVNLKFLLYRAILVEKFVLIFSQNIKIEPLTTALSFYPRLEFSTQVTEKHVKLISEKFPGLKIWENILKGGRT